MRIQNISWLQRLMQNSIAFKALVYLVIAVASPLAGFKNYSLSKADISTFNIAPDNYHYFTQFITPYQLA